MTNLNILFIREYMAIKTILIAARKKELFRQ